MMNSETIIIKNIKQLVGVVPQDVKRLEGAKMGKFPVLEDAFLVISGDKISAFGKMENYKSFWSGAREIDATGRLVMPSFCDSHTHLIYASSREGEFIDRVKGLTYQEIAKKGGGILNSAKKLHNTSENDLFSSALERLNDIISTGTGAVEIKSGYGLNVEDEIKMLRVAARLKEASPLTIKTNLLGAHAFPAEYKGGREDEYVDLIVKKMIPQVAAEGLAEYVDVFCDEGFFSCPQTERILEAGAKYGLRGKIHANELAVSGGVQVGVKHNALSVDHLEEMDDESIAALAGSHTIGTLLPGASFFLGINFAPARKMIDSGLAVAIASDFNPGSSPSGNMQFMLALGVVKMKMLPLEAIAATTLNGAYALGLNDTHGSIAIGKQANIIITKPIPSIDYIPYRYTENHIHVQILNGKIVYTN